MSTFFYWIRQGFANLFKNILFSMASVITIGACIFLFCLFTCLTVNVQHIAKEAETTIGITVFFQDDATAADKEAFRREIEEHGGVRDIVYKSAEEAWETFQADYFGENAEELAEAFADDNPLAKSDSYEIFLENIEDQEKEVEYIRSFPAVREVNYANTLVAALKGLNRVISVISGAIILVLFAISIFLISNTISNAAHFRRRENEIMKLIGATNSMIRAPFVVEGVLIGLFGALIPLVLIYFIYAKAEGYVAERIHAAGSLSALRGIVQLLPFGEIYPRLMLSGLVLGVGMGFVVSFMTIRKHLKV